MSGEVSKATIKARRSHLVILEKYTYTAGAIEPLPKHAHQEYQFGVSWHRLGEFYYRGAYQRIPQGDLAILQSGEMHIPNQSGFIPTPAVYWMMYVEPDTLQAIANELTERPTALPFFPLPSIAQPALIQLFLQLHQVMDQAHTQLEHDVLLNQLFTHLLTHHALDCPPPRPLRSAQNAVGRACEFLQDHCAEDVSLQTLADYVQLSPSYLRRAFNQEMKISPHVYQMQIRIGHAKRLLLQKKSIAEVASLTGFYDQSHFGQQFKRWVGVTPGLYRCQ